MLEKDLETTKNRMQIRDDQINDKDREIREKRSRLAIHETKIAELTAEMYAMHHFYIA